MSGCSGPRRVRTDSRRSNPEFKLAACKSNKALPRGLSGLTNFLLLVDLRSGLGDAAFYEISLNLELLLRAQVHHGVEGQVAW